MGPERPTSLNKKNTKVRKEKETEGWIGVGCGGCLGGWGGGVFGSKNLGPETKTILRKSRSQHEETFESPSDGLHSKRTKVASGRTRGCQNGANVSRGGEKTFIGILSKDVKRCRKLLKR